ncbi:MAG: hypothetical protein JO128_16990 [Alphaproteobacteria bacterium]|nr:hypothetical protein [Alphaproteobacteria bacterium]
MTALHAASKPAGEAASPAPDTQHQSFLIYDRFLYLKIAVAATTVAIVLYLAHRPDGSPYGGTWLGYGLGTVGALLIVWLMWFGYRKRSYTANQGKLEAWLSAHVYLGLSLLVIATLHTGFHFGWNIHTLAYALMCVVILSGACGVFFYVTCPPLMTQNRRGATMTQMMSRIAALNDEITSKAMGLDNATVAILRRATETTLIGGSFWRQLTGHYPDCTTAAALRAMAKIGMGDAPHAGTLRQIRMLLDEKAQLLGRARRDLAYKAMLDAWLYVHVPLSFGLLAALFAHILSVFIFW